MNTEDIESELKMDGCCHRNKLSICLAVLLTLVTLLLFSVAFTFFIVLEYAAAITPECASPSCLKLSTEILESIDDSIDPCDDFHQFVCGKFMKSAYEKQINNYLNAERDRIKKHTDNYIIDPLTPDDPQPVKMQKAFFQSCLNETKIDEDGDKTFKRKLNSTGEWHILRGHDWQEYNFDWVNMMIKARDLGLPHEWFLKVDLHDDRKYNLKLTHPDDCGVNVDEEYFSMQEYILKQLREPKIDTIFELRDLVEFQKRLNSICSNITDFRLSVKRIYYMQDYTIKTIVTSISGAKSRRIDSEVAIEWDYFLELSDLLKRTPKKVQADYISWKMIEYFAPYLSEPIRERYLEYLNAVSEEEINRFQFCLQDTKFRFKSVSEIVELMNYDQFSIQDEGEKLVSNIKEEVINSIDSVRWRDNKTKESHLDLYENIEGIITGEDEIFNEEFLTEELPIGELYFIRDNIIDMLIDWSKSVSSFEIRMIGKNTNNINFDSIYLANSEFEVVLNEDQQQLIVPATAFHSFLYETESPAYLNYGGLGSIVGMKLVEGLHLLNKNRRESYVGLEESMKCMTESLKNYDMQLNVSLLLSKNFDSLLGQELVYKAYQKYLETNDEDAQLINLPYSPNQLFWIRSSLNWCYQALPEEDDPLELQQIYKYRVMETAKHSQYFAADFNCSMDAPMNPKNKCQLL